MNKIKKILNKIKCLFKHKKIYKVNTNVFSFDENGQYINSNNRVYTKEQINENILKNFKSGEIIHPELSFKLPSDFETSMNNQFEDIDNTSSNIDMQTINEITVCIKQGKAKIIPVTAGDMNNPQFTSFDVTIKK